MMSLFRGLSQKRIPCSASEAAATARRALDEQRPQAVDPALFCIYTAPDDSNRELGRDGRSRAWRVDFYDEREAARCLVRVVDGKARVKVKPHHAAITEYVYACCTPDAARVQGQWVDSPVAAAAALKALERELHSVPREVRDDYLMLALMLPANHLRYTQRNQPVTLPPPPERLCYAVLWSHIDVEDHDALAVYVDAENGEEVACARYRLRPYVIPGVSRDW